MAIGAAIIGAGALGAAASDKASKRSSESQDKARESADEAARLQRLTAQEQLEFAKEQYEFQKEQLLERQQRFDSIYGSVESNLSNYFRSLTPERIEALGISNVDQQYGRAIQSLEASFAQRGLSGSGVAAKTFQDLEISRAEARAGVRAGAEASVAQQQIGFVSGRPQSVGTPNPSGVLGAFSNQSAVFGQQSANQAALASQYGRQASAYGAQTGQIIGQSIGAAIPFIGGQFGATAAPAATAVTPTVPTLPAGSTGVFV